MTDSMILGILISLMVVFTIGVIIGIHKVEK